MKLEQIRSVVINSLQMVMDEMEFGLRVGPITDDDFKILTSGYSDLEWAWGLEKYGNSDNRFDFCVKIQQDCVPDGALLGSYDSGSKVLELHFIENFARSNSNHPLHGRMFHIALLSSYIFICAVDGVAVHLVDPLNDSLVQYYGDSGFTDVTNSGDPGVRRLGITRENLRESLKRYS